MMRLKDLHHDCNIVPAYAGGTIATDTNTDGIAVDRLGFEACEFALYSGTITDGTYDLTVLHSDTDSNYAAAPADSIIGAAQFVAASDNVVKRIGYIGNKRYVKLRITSASTTSGGVFKGAIAVLASPYHAPVADN